jgi:murein DD-endopeptidase MepM/ murein hydrolase activator NlpD
MATQQIFSASDDENPFSSQSVDKFFKSMEKGLQQDLKLIKEFRKVTEDIKKNMQEALKAGGGSSAGSGKVGLGAMPNKAVVGGLLAAGAAYGGTKMFMGMAPNTMAAVTQRMSADTVAGISGLNARQVILRSNARVGNGATSAMGPTMAQMNMLYGGGYTATSLSSRNVMSQLGGLSAITGGTNEQMAQGMAGINAMRFLRIGVQARDSKGNLRPPNQLINETYRFLYGGRKITPEQAAMVLNPGSKGYQTISMIAGGDSNLMSILQMGIIARAKKDSPLSKKDLGNAQRSLDVMGVGKESPIRKLFNYNTSEARKLQTTEKGLVGGYNTALSATTAVNNGFSSLAEATDGLTQAFMGLKGFLQTLPGAGNTGATLAGMGSSIMGMGSAALQFGMLRMMMGKSAVPAALTAGASRLAAGAGLSAVGAGATGAMFSKGSLLKRGGRAALAAGAYYGMEKLQGFLNKANVPSWLRRGGNVAFDALQGGVTGGIAAGPYGALAGSVVGTGAGVVNPYGQGGGDCAHGNIGSHNCGGMGGGQDNMVLQMPVPPGTRVTSGFGPRDNSKNPQISRNHTGIDYAVKVGTPIVAAGAGVVTETGLHRQYGNYVIIRHGSRSTLYAHLSKILVNKGEKVVAGQQIALSGGKKGAQGAGTSTGPHLHFEVRANGGVGAQGRKDPQGLFGKAFSFIKGKVTSGLNFLKRTSNRLFGTNFAYSDAGDDKFNFNARKHDITKKTLGQYNSASVSDIIAGLNFSPTSYSELSKHINPNDPKFGKILNQNYDEGHGNEKGIYGGSRQALMQALHAQGFRGKSLRTAFAVALAESGGRPSAIGDVDLQDKKWGPSYGIFQIRSLKNWQNHDGKGSSDPWRNAKKLRDPKFNIEAAWVKSSKGKKWEAWSAYNNGAFTKFLDDADRVATKAGIGGGPETAGGFNMAHVAPTETSHSPGARSVSSNSNVNIKVNMQVTLANSGPGEAQRLLRTFKEGIEKELEIKGIGGY